jgi:amino acid adenylation domain-containing protein
MLGILKAGGAYVPLDPTYPRERLAFMLRDAAVGVLLTQHRLAAKLPESSARRVYLDDEWLTIGHEPATAPLDRAQPHHLAYVIYTSGSTGQPKGVLIAHQSLVCSTSARFAYYGEHVARYLLLSSFAFDSSVAGIFWTLCDGGTLILPDLGTERDPALLAALIATQRISHVLALPSLYALLLAQAHPGQLDSLRTVIVAGEVCPGELANHHRALLPKAAFFNEYGPTEATVWSTVYKVESSVTTQQVPLGRPIPNAQVYLLDRHQRIVPVGVAGELYIGGPALARGYHNQPALTAERFIASPFHTDISTRLYRTGDLARYLPDGTLEFLGRFDDQVKLHGYRIELGEVASVLRTHPGVRDAAVARREDAAGGARLVGYVVPRDPRPPTATELRDHLRLHLPSYMVPTSFVILRALPLSPNGKLSPGDLPAPDGMRPDDQQDYVAPRTPTEVAMARIWANRLNLDRVSIHENFFEIGGDSLAAMRAMAQLNAELDLEMPVSRIFEAPTIAELAADAERFRASGHTRSVKAIRPLSREAYRKPRPPQ